MNLKRICPICSSEVAEELCRIEFSKVDDEFLPQSFTVVVCSSCGFCFDNMGATQKDFDCYYNKCVKYQVPETKGSGGDSIQDVLRYEAVFVFCKAYLTRDSSILDIGAGKGGFLRYLQQKGFCKTTAIEPSAHGRNCCGISFLGSIQEVKKLRKKFDFIFCMQILEHIYDLKTFIYDIQSLLSDGGMCYIEVPNAELYSSSYIAPFHFFDREHINHFTGVSLNNFFVSQGFEKLQERKFNYVYENIGCIFGKNGQEKMSEFDYAGVIGIKKYVHVSAEKDTFRQLQNAKPPVLLWGLGAYLRRVILKDEFPKNVMAIIDRDRGRMGLLWNGIPIVTSEILSTPEFSNATVIITSVLYAEEIKKQISALNFRGTVLTAF